ncbi:ATP-binding protein [bacterium]|nr:ATP-binding protein [bacterium]
MIKRLVAVFLVTLIGIVYFATENNIELTAYDVKYILDDQESFKNKDISENHWQEYTLGKGIDHYKKPYVYWIRFKFNNKNQNLENPALALGKIGDVEEVYFNGEYLGANGRIEGKSRSFYHYPRIYRIQKNKIEDVNTVAIRAKKSAILRAGIHSGPVAFGDYEDLRQKVNKAYFLVYYLGIILGFFSLVMGVYHLYLYIRMRDKIQNLYYFCFSLFSSAFIYSLSWGLTVHFKSEFVVAQVNCFLGVMTAVTYLIFIQRFLNITLNIKHKVFIGIQLIFPIICLFPKQVDAVFNIYSIWFVLGLGTIIYAGYLFIWHYYKNNREDLKVLMSSIVVMLLCAFHDILHSLELFSSFQLSGVGFFSLNIGIMFSLAKDFTTAYKDVEQTVRERTDELEKAIDHVKMVEDQKKRVFTNISHDLKTPIAVAIHKLDELSEYVLKEKGREVLIKSNNALLRLNSMVKNILDTISSESGTIKLIWNKDNAVKFIKDWKIDFEEVGKLKNKTVHFSSNQDEINIPWDRDKMNRVFDNFMTNALKYCPENGDIYIRLIASGTRFQLEVEDTGEGLPEEEWKSVFKRFYQGSSTNLRDHGGFGIGLSFVYEVINKMNGNVFITHGDVGKIKFVVELPINQDIDLIESEAEQEISELRPHTLKAIAVAEYPRKYPEKENPDLPRLLVAEDNPDIAENLLYILQKDYNVYFAENGLEAIGVLEKISIDCILSDLMMPKMDGSELLSRVREDYRWKLIPFIMVTSKSDRENIIEHLNSGAQDYITKPFEKDILKARVLSQSQTSIIRKHMLNSDKLAALGVLAAGIAHELKNPIHAAKNFTSIIRKRVQMIFESMDKRDPEFEKKMNYIIDRIEDNNHKMDEITQAIGSYTNGNKEKVDININEMIDSSILLFGTKLKQKSLTIEKQYTKDNVHILGFSPLNQCVVNLIDNAIAVAKDKIVIETERTEQRVCIRVKDDGEGIAPELQNKIFDMFMTTKPPGEGTGLGLSIVKNIVELQHGGTIEILSSTPNGTTFEIKVPFEAPDPEDSGVNVFHGKGETHAY